MDTGVPAQRTVPTRTENVLDRLARRVATFGEDEVTARGRALVHAAFVDTLGVAIAGAGSGLVKIMAEALGPKAPGASLVLGTAERTNALDAGLLNGAAAHVLDFDDGNSIMAGHPSAMLVPAVLALGEELGSSAREVILAYVAGYEVIVRLSRGVNTFHYEKGWHPTSTLGVFGVAAAASRLLKLDPARTAAALAIACSMASGVKANFGTMVKSLHIGHGIRDGLYGAKLAAAGFTANAGALEAPQGFLTNFNGAGNFDLDAILEGLDNQLEVNRETNKIKRFACCASTHGSVDAALALRRAHAFDIADIERITLTLDRRRIPHTDRPRLQEALSGKFSQQYLVARALLDGTVALRHFDGNAHEDPAVLALMRLIELEAAADGELPDPFAAKIRVRLRGGRMLEGPGERPNVGGTGEAQMASPAFWAKFDDCARQAFSDQQADEVAEALKRFDDFGSIRDFMRLLEARSRQGGGA